MWPFDKVSTTVEEPLYESRESIYPEAVKKPAPFPASGPMRDPKMAPDEMDEYVRVAAEIGVDCCTDLVREKLIRCLREENIHRYQNDQVVNYLDDQLGADWEWRGLRTVDVEHLSGWWMNKTEKQRRIDFSKQPYRGAVPLPVLLTVQKIQKAVPEVFFYVSAPKDNDGDPFLAVTNRWLDVYVVERWNEPNFRER